MTIQDIINVINSLHINYKITNIDDFEINTFCSLNELKENAITWLKKYDKYSREKTLCSTSTLFIAALEDYDYSGRNTIFIENLKANFFTIMKLIFKDINPDEKNSIIENTSTVLTSTLGSNIYIGHNCFIDTDVEICDNVTIMHNVVIQGKVKIGKNTFIESGAIIGVSGFGLANDKDGNPFIVPHLGGVIIGENARICAGTCICRGCLCDTVIGDYTKIDNLCHIAHNVNVGQRVAITANCEVSGSVKIGDDTWLGPGTTVMNGISIGEKVFAGIANNIIRDTENDVLIYGNPGKTSKGKEK